MDAAAFRSLISGERRGVKAALLRAGLRAASIAYALAVVARNRAYDLGLKKIERAAVPVVSVGNITAGGTGKTPLVEYLARWFASRGVRACILSRGYGAGQGSANDEALVLARALPSVPHLQGADRAELARVAVERFASQVLILDDGFQHRRLARDLDVVVLDALDPFGCGRLLPRGLLREPPGSLRRADLIVLSRADLVSQERRLAIRRCVEAILGHAADARRGGRAGGKPCGWVEAAQRPLRFSGWSGEQIPLASLRRARVAAFCGIGNPVGFRRTLETLGCDVAGYRPYPDHHPYTPQDVADLTAWAAALTPDAILTTTKDLVKLRLDHLGDCRLWSLEIDVEVLEGAAELRRCLEGICASASQRVSETGMGSQVAVSASLL